MCERERDSGVLFETIGFPSRKIVIIDISTAAYSRQKCTVVMTSFKSLLAPCPTKTSHFRIWPCETLASGSRHSRARGYAGIINPAWCRGKPRGDQDGLAGHERRAGGRRKLLLQIRCGSQCWCYCCCAQDQRCYAGNAESVTRNDFRITQSVQFRRFCNGKWSTALSRPRNEGRSAE